jgi:hypothetical protein
MHCAEKNTKIRRVKAGGTVSVLEMVKVGSPLD